MVRVLLALALLLSVLVLAWMSFLRVNNLAHDVKVLQEEVALLKGEAAPPPAASADDGLPPPPDPSAASGPPPAPGGDAPAPATRAEPVAAASVVSGPTGGFLDDDRPEQFLPLPAGAVPRGAEVTILAVQGEGASEVVLPEPITMTLRPGVPHVVPGICQGPATAAWIFTLEQGAIRVANRECEYPVRALRPRLQVRLLR